MTTVRRLDGDAAAAAVPVLAGILLDVVEGGASVHFLWPLTRARAEEFWRAVAAKVTAGETILLVGELDGRVVGTVSVLLVTIDNQRHRFEIAKMLVHRSARRRGVAATLMRAAEAAARDAGRTVGVLDTVTGQDAERLYRREGWTEVGVIADYALTPHGELCSTTIFTKRLGTPVAVVD
jgi:GNAT superfamily N-acetyltransferase